MIKKFCFSSIIVGGYEVNVDLDTVNTIKDIEQICTSQLIQFLVDNNLIEILEIMKNKTIHIHNLTMEDVKNSKDTEILYVCDRNHT